MVMREASIVTIHAVTRCDFCQRADIEGSHHSESLLFSFSAFATVVGGLFGGRH